MQSRDAATLHLTALPGIPPIEAGDDLAAIIAERAVQAGLPLRGGDVVTVAQKVVSKAEGRLVDLATVTPSERALALAAETGKDARFVELVLSEARRIVRTRPNLIIVEHRLGFTLANAGIDQSNVGPQDGRERALLLPVDPDGSAARLKAALDARFAADIAVVVNDSLGRPWRRGTVGIALGAAGLPALLDQRGQPDMFGRVLESTVVGFADEIAAAASLFMGQGAEQRPVVVLRGLAWSGDPIPAGTMIRSEEEDLFR